MILQPLIENSIKYAIAVSEEGGIISIAGKIRGDMLCLSVAETGPGIPGLHSGSVCSEYGVALTNTRERVSVLYNDRQDFSFENVRPHGLKVTICIPFERSQ
jgi:two-component system LytT family sensor kinase